MVAFGTLDFFLLVGALSIPAVLLGLLERRIKHYGLLASIIVLVALLWHSPEQAWSMLGFVVFQLLVAQAHLRFVTKHGRKVVWEKRLAVIASLLPLAVVKLESPWHLTWLGFLGISYVTFRATQVVIEISDGLVKTLPLLDHLYFLIFFPAVSSGPIDRSRRFNQDIGQAWSRTDYLRLLSRGMPLLVLGAGYKFIGATYFAQQIAAQGNGGSLLVYMYLYSLQLFFDFAGYSHMAVGISHVFGIRTPVNFRMPFVAESIKDFWTRWHITLSYWLRDFVFTRVVMALLRKRRGIARTTAANIAYLVNMLAMGVWHGLSVHYLVYGLYHGLLMVLNDEYERRSTFYKNHHTSAWYRVLAIIVTTHLVMFGFLVFSGRLIAI